MLNCPISHELLVDPVTTTCCGSTFSKQQLIDSFNVNRNCPICRTPMTLNPIHLKVNVLIRNIINVCPTLLNDLPDQSIQPRINKIDKLKLIQQKLKVILKKSIKFFFFLFLVSICFTQDYFIHETKYLISGIITQILILLLLIPLIYQFQFNDDNFNEDCKFCTSFLFVLLIVQMITLVILDQRDYKDKMKHVKYEQLIIDCFNKIVDSNITKNDVVNSSFLRKCLKLCPSNDFFVVEVCQVFDSLK